MSDLEKKRQEAINEVIYTERDFVRDMEYLRDVSPLFPSSLRFVDNLLELPYPMDHSRLCFSSYGSSPLRNPISSLSIDAPTFSNKYSGTSTISSLLTLVSATLSTSARNPMPSLNKSETYFWTPFPILLLSCPMGRISYMGSMSLRKRRAPIQRLRTLLRYAFPNILLKCFHRLFFDSFNMTQCIIFVGNRTQTGVAQIGAQRISDETDDSAREVSSLT